MNLSDEQLTAYLDGESSADVSKSIDVALSNDANVRKRIESLKLDRDALKSAFDSLLVNKKPPSEIFRRVQPVAIPATGKLKIAGVALLCGLAGWGMATFYAGPQAPSWQQQAAVYHSLYVSSTVASVNNSEAFMREELQRVSVALGRQIELEDLRAVDALSYKRSQILGFDGQPLMQIAYLSALGSPVVLCIKRNDHEAQRPVEMAKLEGMAAATWSAGKFEYMLIGGNDAALIEKAAQRFAVLL